MRLTKDQGKYPPVLPVVLLLSALGLGLLILYWHLGHRGPPPVAAWVEYPGPYDTRWQEPVPWGYPH